MTLYILGNGFDLAHKLPTAYWDFRTYLKSAHPEFLEAFEKHYDIYPSMSDEAKKEYLWNRFESNLANIDEDLSLIHISEHNRKWNEHCNGSGIRRCRNRRHSVQLFYK